MRVFLGEYQHSVDDKGRIVLPRKFRDDLARGCVITKGHDRCLFIWTMEGWADEAERIRRLPRTDRKYRDFNRTFFGGASDQKPDKQGRIQLPESLRAFAGLERDVTVVGVADRVEVWATNRWQEVTEAADDYYAGIEEALPAGGEGI